MREMSDVAFERYAEFLRADPIESILARNLSFLLDDTKLVSAVKLDTSLKNRTENGQIVLGGAPYLLRDDFDGRHWTAGLRVLLAHEVQHDNSSDAGRAQKSAAKMQRASLPSRAFARSSGVYSGRD